MKFYLSMSAKEAVPPKHAVLPCFILRHRTWDDFDFETLFELTYFKPDGARVKIGELKILKGDERLAKMKARVEGRYVELETAFNSDDIGDVPIKTWTAVSQVDLLHCYENTASTLQGLKQLITAKQRDGLRGVCPYCGNGAPRQFDHYLQRRTALGRQLLRAAYAVVLNITRMGDIQNASLT